MMVVVVVILTGSFIQGFSIIAVSLTLMFKISSSIDSLASGTQIVVEFDGVDIASRASGKSVKKLSKSHQKVEELSMSLKALKL